MSDSVQPHELQHAMPPCPSPTPRVQHLILCRPLLLLPLIPPTIRVFSNESTLSMRWPKYWSFSFSIIPSKEFHLAPYYILSFIFVSGSAVSMRVLNAQLYPVLCNSMDYSLLGSSVQDGVAIFSPRGSFQLRD